MLAHEGVCDETSGRVLEGRKEKLERVMLTARELAYSTPSFHDLANDSDLTTSMMRVLKTSELFVHPRRFIRVGFPHSLAPSLTTALHQDYRYVQGAIDTLTAWIPLRPCGQSNGTLMLFPGTHKRGLLPVTESSGNSFSFGVSSDGLPEPVFAEVNEGDVVIFHSLTLHGACPNCSDQVRLSMDVRFQRADDRLCASALLPPYITPESDQDPSVWSKDPYYRPPTQVQLIPPTGHLDVEAPSTSSLFTRWIRS
jgi:ectoine hydroxylase-related dioxygenase (phytanoyl-CoA dioxygenase family)